MYREDYELPTPPDRRNASKISKAIQQLGGDIIKHDVAREILEQIADMHLTMRRAKRRVGMLLYGHPGAGKSTLVEAYAESFPREQEAERTRVPVLYVKTPGQPTAKALSEQALIELGDPCADKGGAEQKMKRLLTLSEKCGVEMVILDDIQHLCDNLNQRDRSIAADTIKNWMDKTSIPFVFAGTPTSRNFFIEDKQLGRRVSPKLELPAFCFATDAQQKSFMKLLVAFNERLPFGATSALVHEENPERLFLACGGLIGYLVRLIEEATLIALRSKSGELTTRVLERAFGVAIYPEVAPSRNPFSEKFNGDPLRGPGEPFADML